MGKYTNPVDISSGRRLHVAAPMDDRVVFQNIDDVLDDINIGRTTAWYHGLVALMHEEHRFYVWRLSDNAANVGHPDDPNPNVNVPYAEAFLPSDFQYPPGFPNPAYAGYYFNWYPLDANYLYSNQNPTTATNLEGWPEGSIPGTVPFSELWDKLLYPYVPPEITLAGSAEPPGYYEKGYVISARTLTATVVKNSLDISGVFILRSLPAHTHIPFAPNPNGGDEIWNDLVDIGTGLNPQDVSYYAQARDTQPTLVTSNTIWYRFVYPMYVGNLTSSSPSEAQIKTLNKLIQAKSNVSYEHNFSQSRYVFAYPQSYGSLVSIIDNNGYETIDDYKVISDTFTMLDGASVDYYIYVFEVPGYESVLTDAVNFTNTYKFS